MESWNPSQQLMKETVSVSTTSSIAERNFEMLDRFIQSLVYRYTWLGN